MTDFYSFINSKDIEKHLRDMHYEFTSLEASWLVYQSKKATLQQKIDAWEDIINSMPDCEVPDRPQCMYRESLHTTLKAYIDMINRNLQLFRNENCGAVYTYYVYYDDIKKWIKNTDVFLSESDCLEDFRNHNWEDVEGIMIYRNVPNDKYSEIIVTYNIDEEVMEIKPNSKNKTDRRLYYCFFGGLWFQFPVPFEKGDIVVSSKNLAVYDGKPFVIDGCTAWDKYTKEHIANNGDYTDMNGRGYFQNDDGTVYYECMCNYMDLEYYRGSFDGIKRFLIALSNYEKNKIDVGLLLMSYHKITFDYAANPVMLYNWYTKEGLKLAGLEDVIKNME